MCPSGSRIHSCHRNPEAAARKTTWAAATMTAAWREDDDDDPRRRRRRPPPVRRRRRRRRRTPTARLGRPTGPGSCPSGTSASVRRCRTRRASAATQCCICWAVVSMPGVGPAPAVSAYAAAPPLATMATEMATACLKCTSMPPEELPEQFLARPRSQASYPANRSPLPGLQAPDQRNRVYCAPWKRTPGAFLQKTPSPPWSARVFPLAADAQIAAAALRPAVRPENRQPPRKVPSSAR